MPTFQGVWGFPGNRRHLSCAQPPGSVDFQREADLSSERIDAIRKGG